MKKKIEKESAEVNKSSNQRKCPKPDQRNWKQLKNFNKYRKKSKRNDSYIYILLLSRKPQNTSINT